MVYQSIPENLSALHNTARVGEAQRNGVLYFASRIARARRLVIGAWVRLTTARKTQL